IGRVLLDIITNAFHTVDEKKKNTSEPEYSPEVSITTGLKGQNIFIEIADNGTGIPEVVMGKIFQPFYTTKATGKGTSLGLSMAYDIVRSHDGEVTVSSQLNEGSVFTIELPINSTV